MAGKKQTYIHEFFEKHPNTTYEFLTVLDMDVKEPPYYVIAIFRKEHSYWIEEVLMPPELLRKKYKVGHLYKNDRRVTKRGSIKKDYIDIETSMSDQLFTMSTLFSGEQVLDGLSEYYNKFFQKQWAYKIEMENYVLVIPCYAIASRFYFMSSSMKNAVMTGNMNELYYRVFPIKDDEVKIHIKKKAGKKDLPFICRFLTDKLAWERLTYFFKQTKKSNPSHTSLESYFPSNEVFHISTSYKVLEHKIDSKPVHYVLSINNDDSSLGFSKLEYKQFSSIEKPSDMEPTSFPVPTRNRFKKRRPFNRDKIIRQGTPSSDNLNEIMFEENEKDLNTIGLEINGKNIYMPSPPSPDIDNTDEQGSNSFEPSKADGDDKLSQMGYTETDNEENKEIFKLEDFQEFYNSLMDMNGVQEIEEPSLHIVPKVKNQTRNSISSKSINSLTGKARKYLFAIFAYDNKCVHIVELEHDTWGPSTWLFISNDLDTEYTHEDMENILYKYIDDSLDYKKLKEYALNNFNLAFSHHNHKKGDADDVAIDSWCDNLLEKVYNAYKAIK